MRTIKAQLEHMKNRSADVMTRHFKIATDRIRKEEELIRFISRNEESIAILATPIIIEACAQVPPEYSHLLDGVDHPLRAATLARGTHTVLYGDDSRPILEPGTLIDAFEGLTAHSKEEADKTVESIARNSELGRTLKPGFEEQFEKDILKSKRSSYLTMEINMVDSLITGLTIGILPFFAGRDKSIKMTSQMEGFQMMIEAYAATLGACYLLTVLKDLYPSDLDVQTPHSRNNVWALEQVIGDMNFDKHAETAKEILEAYEVDFLGICEDEGFFHKNFTDLYENPYHKAFHAMMTYGLKHFVAIHYLAAQDRRNASRIENMVGKFEYMARSQACSTESGHAKCIIKQTLDSIPAATKEWVLASIPHYQATLSKAPKVHLMSTNTMTTLSMSVSEPEDCTLSEREINLINILNATAEGSNIVLMLNKDLPDIPEKKRSAIPYGVEMVLEKQIDDKTFNTFTSAAHRCMENFAVWDMHHFFMDPDSVPSYTLGLILSGDKAPEKMKSAIKESLREMSSMAEESKHTIKH